MSKRQEVKRKITLPLKRKKEKKGRVKIILQFRKFFFKFKQ